MERVPHATLRALQLRGQGCYYRRRMRGCERRRMRRCRRGCTRGTNTEDLIVPSDVTPPSFCYALEVNLVRQLIEEAASVKTKSNCVAHKL